MQSLQGRAPIPLVKLPPDYRTNMGSALARCYQQYGPVFRVAGASGESVFLVGPEANRLVYVTHRHAFSPSAGNGRLLDDQGVAGEILATLDDGPAYALRRRLMNPAFTVASVGRYLPVMQRLVRECVADWARRDVVDVSDGTYKLTFALAAETMAGLTPGLELDQFGELYFQLLALGAIPAPVRGPDWTQQQKTLNARVHDLLLPKLAERRASPTTDVLSMLVAGLDQQGQVLADDELIRLTQGLVASGHLTTASMSAWLLYLLSNYPAYVARIRAEQEEILGGREEPTLDDFLKMEVLGNALSETERLYSPAVSAVRGVLEDVPFANHVIPAGATVFLSLIGSHYLPSLWTEPEKFDPDRFAPPREEHRRTPFALVGFGAGPRACLGMHFSKVAQKVLVTHLLRAYDLVPVPGRLPQHIFEMSFKPRDSIKLRLAPRAARA